jgi:hypothetical protein
MTDEKTAPKAARARRNPPMSAAAMRTAGTTEKVIEQWIAYREATPIAAETFMPPALVEALDELTEAVRGA